MQCFSCGFANPDGMKFCGQCGNTLKNICPQCEFVNPPGFKFCGECGASLTASAAPTLTQSKTQTAPPAPEPLSPDAERRQLTVMFCDLADSTKLSGQLDPEDLRDVIRAYQSTSAEVIERYNGHIAQHLGDGLMVYFGWPQAHEDDPQRAIHAGLGILQAIGQLNYRLEQEKDIRLALRIGIHTGLVVVGEIGQGVSQEHLALGETPNIASRIEDFAKPETVVISTTTYQLVQGYFVCEDLGQHMLKGVDESQQVYRVMGASGAQSRFDVSATRGLTPLVGRESEVTLLLERWQQIKDGQGQVVLLNGEAGIGKSRLIQVMRQHIADDPHTRLEYRSSPYHQNTALFPITDMLQRTLQWQQNESPEQKLLRLEQVLQQYRLPLAESVPLFASLLSLPAPEKRYPLLNLTPQRQRQKTLEAIVAMLLELVEQQPVLFILEDLHWTDPSTLELLDLLIAQTPTTNICYLLTCRPEFRPPWGSRSYLTQITLNRLSHSQIEQMAERVAGGKRLPFEVLQQIVEKTDGVPLFVEEMTKAVLESGLLQDVNGQYETVSPLSSLAIPKTLQDSLMARLDRLVTAKAVAQYAAVIGRQFSYALLHAVSQLNEQTLQDELHRLVEAELLYQRGLPPQATYTFKHALIQDAAYQSLLKSTRLQYHQRIARVLEEQFVDMTENQPELLAYHYAEAGFGEQAAAYWQRAGEHAIGRSANVEAASHLTQGLELLKTLPDTSGRAQQELTLQRTLGVSLIATKGFAAPEVEHAYARARALCEQVHDTQQIFPVLFGLWGFYEVRGDLQTARELAEQLLALAQRQQDPALILQGHRALGDTIFWLGEFVSAHIHLEQGMALYDPEQHRAHAMVYGQDPGMGCQVYGSLSLWMMGYLDQAQHMSEAAVALSHEVSHPFSLAFALQWASSIHQFRREAHTAMERAEAVITLSEEHGFEHRRATGAVLRGWALAAQGLVEQGITQLQQGLSALRATGTVVLQPCYLALLVEAYQYGGRAEEGLVALAEAQTFVEKNDKHWYGAELCRLKGALLLSLSPDNQVEAESCFHQALDIARHQQAKFWELRAATSLARLWQSQDRRQEACDLLEPVYGWFTEGFDTADLKEAKRLLEELR